MVQLSNKQKYEIIVRHELGYAIRKIAYDMRINKDTVRIWLKRYRENNNIKRKNGSGRKKKTTTKEDQIIINKITENKSLTAEDIKSCIKNNNIIISKRTIIYRLHENGFVYKKPINKPLLTENHKINRLKWAIKNKNTNWNNIIFSDETSIWKGSNGRKRWVNKNDYDIEKTVKYPIKMHIWGCITK